MTSARSWVATPTLLRRWAFASLFTNITILLTGGAVRLTGSGLGCPTWPRCTDESWVSTAEMGAHGVIEFGNRVLGFVVGAVALVTLIAALRLRPRRACLIWLSGVVLLGVALQGLIGGITVWTDLNPWIVGGHFLVSIAIIAVAFTLWRRVDEPDVRARATVARPMRVLVWLTATVAAALIAVGTIVTGSGPHAGDETVDRNGLDPQTITQLHSDLAFLLLGLALATALALRAVGAGRRAVRAADSLVAVIIAQGVIGIVQHATGLPELLVWLHLLGTCLTWVAVLQLQHTTRVRTEADASADRPAATTAAEDEQPVTSPITAG